MSRPPHDAAGAYARLGLGPAARRVLVAALTAVALLLGLAGPALAHPAAARPTTRLATAHTTAHAQGAYQASFQTLSGFGAVTGQVTLPDGASYDGDDAAVQIFDDTGALVDTTYADPTDHSYGFDNLEPGAYTVAFDRLSGFAAGAAQYYDGIDESEGAGQATPVDVGADQVTDQVDATILPGGTLTGTLVDEDGQPLGGCLVQAYTDDGSLVTRDGFTDGDGDYAIGGLTTGAYRVRVVPFRQPTLRPHIPVGSCASGTQYVAGSASELTSDPGQAIAVDSTRGSGVSVGSHVYRTLTQVRNDAPPTVSGTPQVGSTLTAQPGRWTPSSGTTYAYQWLVADQPVPGQTATTFVPRATDVGKSVRVVVQASRAGYESSDQVASAAVGPVTAAPVPPLQPTPPPFALTAKPKVGGTGGGRPEVGDRLKVKGGTVSQPATKVTFQWYVGGHRVRGAHHAHYRVRSKDAGKKVTVKVVYVRPGYPAIHTTVRAGRVAGGH